MALPFEKLLLLIAGGEMYPNGWLFGKNTAAANTAATTKDNKNALAKFPLPRRVNLLLVISMIDYSAVA